MAYQLLNILPQAVACSPIQGPEDETSQALLAELAAREKAIGQPFRLEHLSPTQHHVGLCVGVTDQVAVFCIPPTFGPGAALYLWAPLERIVSCNGFFKYASPYLPIAKNIHPLVPPLEVGTQYLFKLSEHSLKTLAEDMFNIDTLAKAYAARFAGIKPGKAMPTESEAPALRPLQPRPGRNKKEEPTPDHCP